jgi:hypothetical protein
MATEKQPSERCIKTEGVYGKVSVYVVVVMDGECPVEVQVSVVERDQTTLAEMAMAKAEFGNFERLCNDVLGSGMPVSDLVRFLNHPPCAQSGIIGAALVAAMEA